jgi:hypothetical protein
MCASRSEVGTHVPARLAWSSSVDLRNSPGPVTANGSTGSANPASAPKTYRDDSELRRSVPLSRQTTSSTRAGSAAQYLTAAANPIATPAQSSRRGDVTRPHLKARHTPVSSSRFIQGSRISVCAVVTSSG